MEAKLLVLIVFVLLIILAFLIVVSASYFFTKAVELSPSDPITAKKWDLHGTVIMVFGVVLLCISAFAMVYVTRTGNPFL